MAVFADVLFHDEPRGFQLLLELDGHLGQLGPVGKGTQRDPDAVDRAALLRPARVSA